MHKAIGFVLLSVTDERADKGLGQKFAMQLIGNVNEGLAAKDAEAGNIRFVSAPGLLGCAIAKRTRQRHVVKVRCIPKGIPPVSVGQFGIDKHHVDPLD